MQSLSTFKFIFKRLADDWKLLLSIFSGILVASTLVAGAPVYLNSLERLGLNTAIDRASPVFLDFFIYAPNIPLDESSLQRTDRQLDERIEENLADVYAGRDRYLRGAVALVGTPGHPLPTEEEEEVSRGYFQHISNLEHHVTFHEGRMASDEIVPGERGPSLEAVIGSKPASVFDLEVGDKVTVTPSLGDPTRLTVTIVGIMDATDPSEAYWHNNASVLIEPPPLQELPDVGVEVNPEEPPLVMFITKQAMIDSMGKAFPGTLISSSWVLYVNKEPLKKIKSEDLSARISSMENDLALQMSGSAVLTGVKSLLREFERRSFFSSVPLLLLLTIMVITVLYYMAMMVSYLVQSRENDVALLRSRGVSTVQLVRLYAIEGLILAGLAVVIAPFLAMGAIAIAGKLPFFGEITNGTLIPVELRWTPFLVSVIVGLVSMAIFVIPGVIGARTGLVIHKLRSSRPPSVPLFQRYYLDMLLLVIGGLVFWELNARGQLISGGLFEDIQVNEAMLLAPVLLLTLVALVFMRFFPLFVRFIGGESPTLVHLLVGAATTTLVVAMAVTGVRGANLSGQLLPIALVLAVAGTYWGTHSAEQTKAKIYGLVSQAALVAIVMVLRPPVFNALSFLPSIGLMLIVPAQLVFLGFKGLSRVAPVWVSMGLWHMARNPLQYSWLVLLLVMVTGLGVLATTVGGTLNRSYEERVKYDVVADLRVTGVPASSARSTQELKERYLTIPGVTSVSMGMRGVGIMGSNYVGSQVRVLAVESHDFHYMSWYRDDFSERPLPVVMRALQPVANTEPVVIPDGATTLGLWVKPEAEYSNVFLWAVLQDSRGALSTVTFGEVGPPEWHLMTATLPRTMRPPLQLASIQIFEPVFGPTGTPGFIKLDDIHAIGPDGSAVVLEDFESMRATWLPLATSALSSDSVKTTRSDVLNGNRSGIFSFGKDTDRGIRGFYHSPNAGPLPIVASSTFVETSGVRPGDPFIMEIMGRFIPVAVQDTVQYFPTMDPRGTGFVIADLDSLLRHVNILSPTKDATPNEIYIDQAPGAGESVRNIMAGFVGDDLVRDRETQLREIRLDPLITAGWKAMLLLAIAIIIFSAGLGYITYLLAFADRNRSEIGFLQSLGLSRRQMMGLLGLEHMVIVFVGLALGTITGWVMSDLMVSSVAVTEEGAQVLPPFILQTDLRFLVLIYAALIGIFLASIYRLTRAMLHVDLHAISRMEGV